MYKTNNFHYLRISKTSVLRLNLLLSKEDLDWFNDYSFQEILSVLKPLLLSRIALYDEGHIIKRSIAPSTYTSIYHDQDDDGLTDAGVILGGVGTLDNQEPETLVSTGKRRRGQGGASGNSTPMNRPQFSVRFGMRPSTASERGGAIMVADKKLGFVRVKEEQVDKSMFPGEGEGREASQRIRMDLAELEGETGAGSGAGASSGNMGDDAVMIREEDDSDSLHVSDFRSASVEEAQEGEGDEDYDYPNTEPARGRGALARRKQDAVKSGNRRGKGKRARAEENPPSQMDQKPTLQVTYGALKVHPQMLYIVVRSVGSSAAQTPSILPYMAPVETAVSSSSSSSVAQTSGSAGGSGLGDQQPEEEEDSLFPPGLDLILS